MERRSFYQCKDQGQNCYISNYVNGTGEVILDQDCAYYVDTMEDGQEVQRSNQEVEMWLEDEIINQNLKYVFSYIDEFNNASLYWVV